MEVRAALDDADLERLLEVRNAVFPDDPIALAEIRSFASQVADMLHFLASDAERPVGSAVVAVHAQSPDPFAETCVLPSERRRGIGSALYETVSDWARDRGKEVLEVWIEDSQPDGLSFARNRGFAQVARELRVALDLTRTEAPRVEPPPGVTITAWAERPDLARGMYAVALEALPDIPGEEEHDVEPFEDWLAHEMQAGPGDRPEATFVALAGDEVVGYSKFSLTDAQPTTAHHDVTGVKRAWRQRGVARALKQTQIAWAKDAGYERLVTSNEERNEPIRRLNEHFGYEPAGGRTLFRGPLSGDS